MSDLYHEAKAAGFSDSMARFISDRLAEQGHTHAADEIIVDSSDGETQEEFNARVSDALADEDEEDTTG